MYSDLCSWSSQLPWRGRDSCVVRVANQGAPVVRGDEMWFYYRGNTIDGPKKSWQMGNGIAVLRRDGFASLDAGDEPGVVITRPMVFEGKGKLFVNVDVATGGYARASVVDESGDPIDGFGKDDCVAVTDDKTCAAFHWKSNQTLAALKDRYVRVVFHLHDHGRDSGAHSQTGSRVVSANMSRIRAVQAIGAAGPASVHMIGHRTALRPVSSPATISRGWGRVAIFGIGRAQR